MAVTPPDELTVMAQEELNAACSLSWPELKRITPWGDSFEGFAPSGRTVEVERRYLWALDPEGAIIVEVEVRDAAAREGVETRAILHAP
ncbi:hypothetical protein [Brevundimonas sp.]|uniref:hypothetical protein n=1 Tax=Brevundimonas sp. TaxID=1871086 RepID=UPI00286C5AF1|nr:hypothetical protein [Brevundimonas sp.]